MEQQQTLADRVEPFSKSRHGALRIVPGKVEAISAANRMIPLVASEFLKAAVQYPILFTKNAATGKFLPVALLGFEEEENLFWRDGGWDGLYVPLNVARQPFFLAPKEGAGADDFLLCIDHGSPCLDRTAGEPLFDATGEASAALLGRQDILRRLVIGERQTRDFIAAMLANDLLTDVALDITFANGDKRRMQGLYSIDEAKLDALDDAALLALRKAGYLPFIYAMIVSLSQIFALIERRNKADERARQWFQPGAGQ